MADSVRIPTSGTPVTAPTRIQSGPRDRKRQPKDGRSRGGKDAEPSAASEETAAEDAKSDGARGRGANTSSSDGSSETAKSPVGRRIDINV